MPDDPHASTPTPGVTRKAACHHGDLRAQLITAVRELVETHGPDGFSVAEAARRAGVSSAAPCKHFKDRHKILRGVVSAAMDRLQRPARLIDRRAVAPAGWPCRFWNWCRSRPRHWRWS